MNTPGLDLSVLISFVSLLIAIVSAWIARADLVANNKAILALVRFKCVSGSRAGMPPLELYHKLEIRLKNKGVPLYNPEFALAYNSTTICRITVPIKCKSGLSGDAKMERCMIVDMSIATDDDSPMRSALSEITDPKRQCACILVASQGFVCAEIPLYPRFPVFTAIWNRFGVFLQSASSKIGMVVAKMWRKKPIPNGPRIVEYGTILMFPYAVDYAHEIDAFNSPTKRSI